MWLALDTATERASVAVGVPGSGVVLGSESLEGARRHAAMLWPLVDRCLAGAGASLGQIQGVVLADGPGSFTGLRVSAAAAKALVRARSLPLATAPSLLAAAAGAGEDGCLTVALSDALRGELFAGAWRIWPDRVETVLAPTVIRRDEVRAVVGRPERVVGPAAPLLGGLATFPQAAALLGLVGRVGGAAPVVDIASWEPQYGRPAEAQAKWERAHGRRLPDTSGQGG
jgi:tRNA threonylcarbamoyl adenosine modification protein YeaZ